jgi:hypothetical protein
MGRAAARDGAQIAVRDPFRNATFSRAGRLARRLGHDRERSASCPGTPPPGALFERGEGGEGPRNLDRAFSGTYREGEPGGRGRRDDRDDD